jgi:hypothetical protein
MKIEEMNWCVDELRLLDEYLRKRALTVASLIDEHECYDYHAEKLKESVQKHAGEYESTYR